MAEALILSKRDGAVTTVTIHRPEKRNAVTRAMMRELIAVSDAFAQDEVTRARFVRKDATSPSA